MLFERIEVTDAAWARQGREELLQIRRLTLEAYDMEDAVDDELVWGPGRLHDPSRDTA